MAVTIKVEKCLTKIQCLLKINILAKKNKVEGPSRKFCPSQGPTAQGCTTEKTECSFASEACWETRERNPPVEREFLKAASEMW